MDSTEAMFIKTSVKLRERAAELSQNTEKTMAEKEKRVDEKIKLMEKKMRELEVKETEIADQVNSLKEERSSADERVAFFNRCEKELDEHEAHLNDGKRNLNERAEEALRQEQEISEMRQEAKQRCKAMDKVNNEIMERQEKIKETEQRLDLYAEELKNREQNLESRQTTPKPEINVPKFSGELQDFANWKSQFDKQVHGSTTLTPAEKLNHLLNTQPDMTAQLITEWQLQTNDYAQIYKQLNKTYDNKYSYVMMIFNNFERFEQKENTPSDHLRNMAQAAKDTLRYLKQAESEFENFEDTLVPKLVLALPKEVRKKFQQTFKNNDRIPTLEEVTQFMLTYAQQVNQRAEQPESQKTLGVEALPPKETNTAAPITKWRPMDDDETPNTSTGTNTPQSTTAQSTKYQPPHKLIAVSP